MSEYKPITIYDAPGVLFEQLLDGELTARGAAYTIFNPKSLSPIERDSMAERFQAAAGGNPVVGALAGIVTNPWVWASFLLSPAATKAFAAGRRNLYTVNKDLIRRFRENPHSAMSIGLQSLYNILDNAGGGIAPAYHSVAQIKASTHTSFVQEVQEAIDRFATRNNLSLRDMGGAGDQITQDRVREVWDLFLLRINGFDETTQYLHKIDKSGPIMLPQAPLVEKAALDRAASKFNGLDELVYDVRESLARRKVLLFGKEFNGWDIAPLADLQKNFEIDTAKVARLHRGLTGNTLINETVRQHGIGPSYSVEQLFGSGLGAQMKKAGATFSNPDDFQHFVEQIVNAQLPGFYFPRNTPLAITPEMAATRSAGGVRGASLAPGDHTLARTRALPAYHPDEFQRMLDRTGGGTAEGQAYLKRLQKEADSAITKFRADKTPAFMQAADPFAALGVYADETAATYALHLAPVDRVTLAEQAEHAAGGVFSKQYRRQGIGDTWDQDGKLARFDEAWQSVSPDKLPQGGLSYADVMSASWAHQPDPYVGATIERVLVPQVMGTATTRTLASEAMGLQAKQWARAFVNTSVGKVIAKSGEVGREFITELSNWSDPSRVYRTGSISRAAANYLYVTHQGLNVASAMLNMVQPFGLAASWVGTDNVLYGYAKSIPAVLGYIKDRSRLGLRISEDERFRLVRKHFGTIAEVAGIGPSQLDQIDSVLLKGRDIGGDESMGSALFRASMALFSKAEWMNRAVTAHAVERSMRKAGFATIDPATGRIDDFFRYNAGRTVGAAQFTSDPGNTPLTFLTPDSQIAPLGGLFSNPLARQYMSFPVRSITNSLVTGGRIGGASSRLEGVARTFLRGMGTSALLYELLKGSTGIDYSRGLYYASVTDLIPGMSQGQYDARDASLPLAPIFDIPIDAIKALGDPNTTLLAHVAPRLVPGGIALSRALGVAPQMPPPVDAFQKQFVDWNIRNERGEVPLFKGSGELLSWASPAALILRGLGADLGKFQSDSEVDAFMTKNRDQIVDYKRRYLAAMHANDISAANRIADEYKKRMGFPLTVTRTQIEAFERNRSTTRSERIHRMLPPEARPYYDRYVGPEAPPPVRPADPKEQFVREQMGPGPTARPFEPFTP